MKMQIRNSVYGKHMADIDKIGICAKYGKYLVSLYDAEGDLADVQICATLQDIINYLQEVWLEETE